MIYYPSSRIALLFFISATAAARLFFISAPTAQVASGDCSGDLTELAQDYDYLGLAIEMVDVMSECFLDALDGKQCNADWSGAQKICEDDLKADWFFYSASYDCGGQGTTVQYNFPSCHPKSCTTREATVTEAILSTYHGDFQTPTQNCSAEFKFEDLSAGISFGASYGDLLAIVYGTVCKGRQMKSSFKRAKLLPTMPIGMIGNEHTIHQGMYN